MDYIVSNSSVVSSDYKILGIEVKPKNVRTLNIFGIYRPPDGKVKNFIDYIEEAVEKLGRQRSEVSIGDYNLDYTNDNLLRKYKLKTLEKKLNMRQLITNYTRSAAGSDSLIDLVYTDSPHIVASGIINLNFSDHLPIYYTRNNNRFKETWG